MKLPFFAEENPPRTPYFLDVLAGVVATHGDAIAVEDATRTLSYAELWNAAGEIADRLRHASISHGDVVALRLPRTCDAIAALVGIWRANAVYLPIDPAWPAERVRAIE